MAGSANSEDAILVPEVAVREYVHHQPFVFSKITVVKVIATVERTLADARYAIGNRNRGQTGTIGKRILADGGQLAIRAKLHRGHTIAIAERTLADARHAIRDRDRGQASARVERMIADTRHVIGNRDCGQI